MLILLWKKVDQRDYHTLYSIISFECIISPTIVLQDKSNVQNTARAAFNKETSPYMVKRFPPQICQTHELDLVGVCAIAAFFK